MGGPLRALGGVLRRALRRLGLALAGLLGVGLLVVGAALLWLRTAPGNRFLLGRLLPLVQPDHGAITVGGLETGLLEGAVLTDVAVVDPRGHLLLHADRVAVTWRLGGLPGRRLVAPTARIDDLTVGLADAEACYGFGGMWDPSGAPSTPWAGLGFDLSVPDLVVTAPSVGVCAGGTPILASDVTLAGGLTILGPEVRWIGARLDGTLTAPRPGALVVTADGAWDGHAVTLGPTSVALGGSHVAVDGRVGLDDGGALAVTLREARLDPAELGIEGLLGVTTGSGEVTGTFTDPGATLALLTPGGSLAAVASLHVADTPTWQLRVDTPTLRLDPILKGVPRTEVHGAFVVDGSGFDWPDGITAHATFAGGATEVDGYGPFEAMIDADLAGGVVTLGSARVDAPGGRVEVSGRVDVLGEGWSAEVADSAVALRELAAYGVPGLAGRARFSGHVEGSWAEPVATHATGRLVADGVAWQDTASVAHLEAAVDLRVVGGVPSGHVSLTTTDLIVEGFAGTAARAEVEVDGDRFGLDVSVASDDRELLGFLGEVDLAARSVAANRLHVEPRAGFAWDSTGPVGLRWTDDGVDELQVQLRSGDARVAASGAFHLDGRHDLTFDVARFPLGSLQAFAPSLAGYAGSLSAKGTLVGAAADPTLTATVHLADLTVPGKVHDLLVDATVDAAGHRVGVDGTVRAGDDLSLAVQGGVPFDVVRGIPRVVVDRPVDLRLLLPPTDLARWGGVLDGVTLPDVRASAEVVVGGLPRDPVVTVVASAHVQVGAAGEEMDVDLDATLRDGEVTSRTVARSRLARRAELTGGARVDVPQLLREAGLDVGADRWEDPDPIGALAFDVVPLQLPVEALAGLVPLPDGLAGSIVGGVHLGGNLRAPTVEGGLMLIGGRVGDVVVSPAIVSLTPGEGGYDVDLEIGFGQGGRLHASGSIPVDPGADRDLDQLLGHPGLSIRLDGSAIPVAVLAPFVPGMVEPAGVVAVGGTVTGSLADPVPLVDASLHGGAFTLYTTNVAYENVDVVVHADRSAVTVRDLAMVTRSVSRPAERLRRVDAETPPNVTGGGSMTLDGWRPAAFDVGLRFDRAWAADLPSYVLRLSGNVDVTGTWPALKVKGRVSADEGRLVVGESFFAGDTSLLLAEDIHVERSGAPEEVAAAETAGGLTTDLDLRVALNRNVDLDVTMPTEDYGGALTRGLSEIRLITTLGDVNGLSVKKAGDDVSVVGQVEPVRGKATVLGKDFAIREGNIAFTGLGATNPLLDITAVHDSQYGAITAHIQGSAEAPTIDLSTDNPEYPSSDDAVSILLFGAPFALLGSGNQSTGALLSLALRSVASAQVAEFGQLTQLDVFELDNEGLRTGKRFGNRVLVTLGFNYSNKDDVNNVEVTVELQLPERWFLELRSGDKGISAASAYRRWRF